jgi:phosphoribosylanthranilate isomerase
MSLKVQVRVGSITNLSDARYCAGMGVGMLGFVTVEDQPNYLDPARFQEIRGWISGPAIVAQIEGVRSTGDIRSIIENYQPDYLELTTDALALLPQENLPALIFKTGSGSAPPDREVALYIIKESSLNNSNDLPRNQCLVELQSAEALQLIIDNGYAGLVLSGTAEIRPGFKEYGELADVLERLEVD